MTSWLWEGQAFCDDIIKAIVQKSVTWGDGDEPKIVLNCVTSFMDDA